MKNQNDEFIHEILQLLRQFSLEELPRIRELWIQEVTEKEAEPEVFGFLNVFIDAVMKEKKEGAIC